MDVANLVQAHVEKMKQLLNPKDVEYIMREIYRIVDPRSRSEITGKFKIQKYMWRECSMYASSIFK